MARHVFLHIGYPKTGSSAIQTTFLASRADLAAQGYFFPDVPAEICNAVMARCAERPETLFPYCDTSLTADDLRQRIDHDFEDLDQALRSSSAERVIISSESLIALGLDAIGRLRDGLLTFSEAITVICTSVNQSRMRQVLSRSGYDEGERLATSAADLPIARFAHQLPCGRLLSDMRTYA